jgi:hypothetical protein
MNENAKRLSAYLHEHSVWLTEPLNTSLDFKYMVSDNACIISNDYVIYLYTKSTFSANALRRTLTKNFGHKLRKLLWDINQDFDTLTNVTILNPMNDNFNRLWFDIENVTCKINFSIRHHHFLYINGEVQRISKETLNEYKATGLPPTLDYDYDTITVDNISTYMMYSPYINYEKSSAVYNALIQRVR